MIRAPMPRSPRCLPEKPSRGRAVSPLGPILLTLLVFASAACSTSSVPTRDLPTTNTPPSRWQCGEQLVELRLGRGESARLQIGRETFDLEQVRVASGAKYQAADDPSTSFWTKGQRALLELHGQRYPECALLKPRTQGLTAQGNEPAWRLDLDDQHLVLVTDYGRRRLEAPAPAPEAFADGRRYRATTSEGTMVVTAQEAICVDTMSGMPYPTTVTVVLADRTLHGCGGDPAVLLQGDDWLVTELDATPLVPRSRVTLRFDAGGRVSGQASCNRYTASYTLTGEELRIGPAATTRMACPAPLLAQEARFLALLRAVHCFTIPSAGTLQLEAHPAGRIVARRL